MRSVDVRDVLAGAVVALVGAVFALSARGLPDGAPGQIGPGFVPTAVGIIAVVLGLAIAARGLGRHGRLPRIEMRPVLAIFASVAAFGLLIRAAGLAPALVATAAVASLGSENGRFPHILALALSVALASSIVFVVLLGLPFDIVRNPF